jgi:1-acyl-sn-glycerol-3-phosphate acyltransferase
MLTVVSRDSETIPPVDSGYRFVRSLLRVWFALFFRKIRLLEEGFPARGAAVLLINHPASLLDALILVAAFERQLHCVIQETLLQGPLRRFLAQACGVIPYTSGEKSRKAAAESCYRLLSRESAVVIFAEPGAATDAGTSRVAFSLATLALAADALQFSQVPVFPVHLLLPVSPSSSTELLIYADAPLVPAEHMITQHAAGEEADSPLPLARALDKACEQNAFRLQPESFEQLLSDFEQVLRHDLEEDWKQRPNWKQQVEGFHLSRFLASAAAQMNTLHPGRLIALWELLGRYREAQRLASLRQLETERSDWLKSTPLRVITWLEVFLGAPVAAYGVLNHLLVLLLLAIGGLLERRSSRRLAVEWSVRGLITLACYIGQVALCGHLLGRAAAGYYAVSLPLSGAYIWRYWWLMRHRGRLAYFAASLPAHAAKIRRIRKQLLMELDAARDKFGVASPHA